MPTKNTKTDFERHLDDAEPYRMERARKAEELIQVRQKISGMLAKEVEKRGSTLPTGRAPRYDDVFFAGVEWLDDQ